VPLVETFIRAAAADGLVREKLIAPSPRRSFMPAAGDPSVSPSPSTANYWIVETCNPVNPYTGLPALPPGMA
jgi:hypothetical protein